ncbi:hypothetical protein N431DRAFT_459362 [Stipitochalara longipes BDJ]|nr:hypothetical protein N431DRAFT_459362 [Stipitochalara longipes BDJ]
MKSPIPLVALAAVAAAGPIVKSESGGVTGGVTDGISTVPKPPFSNILEVGILNYALTLEHLEDRFYREDLANYTQADFIVAATHVSFLSTALSSAAVAECTYSFPSTDVTSFVALASVLEGVGVSAYLGAAASIANKHYLTDAGSILTVESRHSSYIRASLIESPFPQPYDDSLTFNEVYTLAASFIISCPSSNADKPQLPLKAFPSLALGTKGSIKPGDTITLLTPGYILLPKDGKTAIYAAFTKVTGPIYAGVTPVQGGFEIVVPAGINGQSYVVLTTCKDGVNDETIAAGPAIVEITN